MKIKGNGMKKLLSWILIFLFACAASVSLSSGRLKPLNGDGTGDEKGYEMDDGTPPSKESAFKPWYESFKKGWTEADLEKEETKEVEDSFNIYEADEKAWEAKIEELKKKVLETDTFAKAVGIAKNLILESQRKEIYKGLENPCSGSLICVGRKSFNSSTIRSCKGLSTQEREFRSRRYEIARTALDKFLGKELKPDVVHNSSIAFIGTGGGYRAMILTTGYLAGLEEIGLLDGIMYASTLSGSTWMLAPWITGGGTVHNFAQELEKKINNNAFNILKLGPAILSNAKNLLTIADTILWPKFLWGQPVRSIDFYGFLLGQVLFGNNGYKELLSKQWKRVQGGNYPWPIYNTISISKKGFDYSYDWYEFNPVEVRVDFKKDHESDNDFLIVPVCAMGTKFSGGKAVESPIAPEQMIGYWLGTFGSAYAINAKDISNYIAYYMGKELKFPTLESISFIGSIADIIRKIEYFVAFSMVTAVKSIEGVGKARVSPAQIYNPFKGFSEAPEWLQAKKYLTLVDAAIECNVPGRPLLWPDRKVKFIIIGESSSISAGTSELKKFFEEANKLYGYNYERIDDLTNTTLRLYRDRNNKAAPRIIYINYIKDKKIMALTGPGKKLTKQQEVAREHLKQFIHNYNLDSFDPAQCAFCDTFNFEYTAKQFKQLAGIAEFNVRANKEVIAHFINSELEGEELTNFPDWGVPTK